MLRYQVLLDVSHAWHEQFLLNPPSGLMISRHGWNSWSDSSDDISFDYNEYWQVPTREDWEGWQSLNLKPGHKGVWQRSEDAGEDVVGEPQQKRPRS